MKFTSVSAIFAVIAVSTVLGGPLDCPKSKHTHSSRGTGYFPADDPIEGGFKDCRGKALYTLQAFLAGKAPWVDVAMDSKLKLKYGLELCIPELNKKYGKMIKFRVQDTGPSFTNKKFGRIDICTENRQASEDRTINGKLTLVFPKMETCKKSKSCVSCTV